MKKRPKVKVILRIAFCTFVFVLFFVGNILLRGTTYRPDRSHPCQENFCLQTGKVKKGRHSITSKFYQGNQPSLNRLVPDSKMTVVYTRVFKTGSSTFGNLLIQLSLKNNFTFYEDSFIPGVHTMRDVWLKTYEEQEKLMRFVTNFTLPVIFFRHMYYSNFTRHNIPQPMYISMVRDPIERVISWYYFTRQPAMRLEYLPLMDPERAEDVYERKEQSFEQCILNGDIECRYVQGDNYYKSFHQQTLFFCGNDIKCHDFNGQYPLHKAKENVEKHFEVVGVIDELFKTLAVFERYLPRFFKDASDVYQDLYFEIQTKAEYRKRYKISAEVRRLLERNFTREIEFYEFCKQRLFNQYHAVSSL